MNYYELFRYKKADGGKYSGIDLSNLDARYNMMLNAIKDQKSLVSSSSPKYTELLEAEKALKTAYSVLSDKTKRAEYDASLTSRKSGGSVSRKVAAAILVAVIATSTLGGCTANKNNEPAQTEIVNPVGGEEESEEATIQFESEAPTATEAPTTATTPAPTEEPQTKVSEPVETEAPTEAPVENPDVRDDVETMADVMDDAVVMENAKKLAKDLEAANVVNPVTSARWTAEEIFKLIKFSMGVYNPESMEEIDILYLDILNLFISPLNTDDYLYHVVFASGNDDFNALLNPNIVHAGFADAFTAYGRNGVYPLVKWFEQKRFDIYSSLDREEVNAIYREVGQVMADLMKGNGCTITWNGVEYHFTSEQVLANHSSALLITTEFQLIMANHYQIVKTKDNGEEYIEDEVSQVWEVYNKLNSDGVDEFGNPIINPDLVTYDEMNAWVNNGCDIDWAIMDVLIDGQTFGQRIQSDMEGMAQNNYYMYSDGRSLSN